MNSQSTHAYEGQNTFSQQSSFPEKSPPEYSIVIPLYDEGDSLVKLASKINQVLEGKNYEIIFVDDGSRDNSWSIITELIHQFPQIIKGIKHRRNFGKAEALSSGFAKATGEIIITLDADLQDDPDEIPHLHAKLNEGFDMISGWKQKRFDPISKKLPSFIFNFAARSVSGLPLHDFNCGIKAYRREIVKQIDLHGELHRFIPILAHAEGFRVGEQVVKHHPREHGQSKYGWKRLFKGGLDLVTVVLLTRYLKRPAHFFGGLGLLSGGTGSLVLAYLSVMKIYFGQDIGARPLFFFGILTLLLGAQLISTGIIGEYLLHYRRREQDNSSNRISDESH